MQWLKLIPREDATWTNFLQHTLMRNTDCWNVFVRKLSVTSICADSTTQSCDSPNFRKPGKILKRNIKFAINYGALFEVNAAALRKGWLTPYPGEDVVAVILELGGRLALSDDSHGPYRVGEQYPETRDYLQQLGVKELWYLSHSSDGNAFERGLAPARVAGDWWEHDFWKRCAPSVQA